MGIDKLVKYCINCEYVTEERAPWLSYALKKRMSAFLTSIPILIIASYISSPILACFFYFSFSWLRARTNGIHARTYLGCVIASLCCVVVIVGPIYQILTDYTIIILFCIAAVVIWLYAPFNHPNMHLSDEERRECSKSARLRLLVLMVGMIILQGLNQRDASIGIILGAVMDAILLALAYILKPREELS